MQSAGEPPRRSNPSVSWRGPRWRTNACHGSLRCGRGASSVSARRLSMEWSGTARPSLADLRRRRSTTEHRFGFGLIDWPNSRHPGRAALDLIA